MGRIRRAPEKSKATASRERDFPDWLRRRTSSTNLPQAMRTDRPSRKRDASNFDDYLMLIAMIALIGTLVVL